MFSRILSKTPYLATLNGEVNRHFCLIGTDRTRKLALPASLARLVPLHRLHHHHGVFVGHELRVVRPGGHGPDQRPLDPGHEGDLRQDVRPLGSFVVERDRRERRHHPIRRVHRQEHPAVQDAQRLPTQPQGRHQLHATQSGRLSAIKGTYGFTAFTALQPGS